MTIKFKQIENKAIFKTAGVPGQRGLKGDPGEGEIVNVGSGIGIFKDTVNSVSSLKSLLSFSDILLINGSADSVGFDIDTNELNDFINANSAITTINNAITNINSQLSSLSTTVGNNTSSITGINTAINTINNAITSINSQLSGLSTNVGNNTTNIATNTSSITSINTQLTNINTAITNLQSKVLPSGGTTGQVLAKKSATDFDVQWITPSSGGSGGGNDFSKEFVWVIQPSGNGISGLSQTFQAINVNLVSTGLTNGQMVSYIAGNESYYFSPKLFYQLSTTSFVGCRLNAFYLNFSPYDEGFTIYNEWGINNSIAPVSNGFVCGLGNPNSVQSPDSIFTTAPNYFFLGVGHSQTDNEYYLVQNMYGLSQLPVKISLSNFTGNLQPSDYQARVQNNHYKLEITNTKSSTYIIIKFTNITTGRSGTYNLNFSDMRTFDRNDISVNQIMFIGSSSNQAYYNLFRMFGSKKVVY